jgi:arylformamidase
MSDKDRVWRDLDQAALDAQYNLRAASPDHPAYFARWAAASAAARERLPLRRDLAYGEAGTQTLDLFTVPGAPAPLLVFLHGGWWQAMDKSDFSFIAPAFHALGIAVAVVNYSLAPAATVGAIVEESRAALAFLRRRAGELGIDAGRLAVAGHSAGGHLAAMLALDEAAFAPPVVCAISGVFDLEPIRLCYLNRVLGLTAAEMPGLSPLRLLEGRRGPIPMPRLLLAVGGRETAELRRQQAEFAACWQERVAPPAIVEQPEDDHFSIMDRLAQPASPLCRALADAISGGLPAAGA